MNFEQIKDAANESNEISFSINKKDVHLSSLFSKLYLNFNNKKSFYNYLSNSEKFIKLKGLFFIKKEYGINNIKEVNSFPIVEIWENENFSYEINIISNNILQKSSNIIDKIKFHKDYTIIDIQTTGINIDVDKIIAVAIINVKEQKIISKNKYYVNPNLSEEELKKYQSIQIFSGKSAFSISKIEVPGMKNVNKSFITEKDVIKIIARNIKNEILVGHNLNFKINMINSLFKRNNVKENITVKSISREQICTLKALNVNGSIKNNSLDAWIKRLKLNVYDRSEYHDPLNDSEILFNIIDFMKK
jgi:DNA polymerase III alpha subunit (gram-positive type)